MAKTGERYAAARQALIHQASTPQPGRQWVAMPEMSDDAIHTGTGKDWNEWCDLIDQFEGRGDGHKAIAQHVQYDFGLDGWWSQAVTVGYERITGIRLPHQMADGTFTANKSRTLACDPRELRRLLLTDEDRSDLFPDVSTVLRSKPTAKAIRIRIGPGVASISIEDRGSGRAKVTVQHEKLPSFDDVEEWKYYWGEWLEAVEQS